MQNGCINELLRFVVRHTHVRSWCLRRLAYFRHWCYFARIAPTSRNGDAPLTYYSYKVVLTSAQPKICQERNTHVHSGPTSSSCFPWEKLVHPCSSSLPYVLPVKTSAAMFIKFHNNSKILFVSIPHLSHCIRGLTCLQVPMSSTSIVYFLSGNR